jgi:hypothetical protein
MRRRRSSKRSSESAFLDGTHSELSDFGETGVEGFASAWGTGTPEADTERDDVFEQFEDRSAQRARDLERSSHRGLVFLALVLVAGTAAAVAVRSGVFGDESVPSTAAPSSVGEILAIGDVREYDASPTDLVLMDTALLDQSFRTEAIDDDPYPIEDSRSVAPGIQFSPVFWGGRAHIAIVGEAVGGAEVCVVASLVTADLRPIDVASHGSCVAPYAATGDRVACHGNNVVLLEIWPYDPDAVIEKPPVEAIRVRVEADGQAAGAKESRRGVVMVQGELVEDAEVLGGAPGDTATLRAGAQTATCELLQRAEVQVQLL